MVVSGGTAQWRGIRPLDRLGWASSGTYEFTSSQGVRRDARLQRLLPREELSELQAVYHYILLGFADRFSS